MADTNKIARRTFFSGLGLAVAAGVVAKVASTVSAEKTLDVVVAEPAGNGYRLTEHVKKYYRTTTL
ncbi:MAG: hypothetical protein ACOH2B_06390 [Burkholderiaceae bacterium]